MKSIKRLVAVVIACVAFTLPAAAQFNFGIKAGAKINQLPDIENLGAYEIDEACTGFTGGVMGEFTLPIVGLGIDASIMYSYEPIKGETVIGDKETTFANHYLDIPINLKYKLILPAVERFVAPYVFTGPNISFALSKDIPESISSYFVQNPVEFAWNLGIGLELFNHLQIGASYGWGLNKYIDNSGILDGTEVDKYISNGNFRKNCWTITAAYVF